MNCISPAYTNIIKLWTFGVITIYGSAVNAQAPFTFSALSLQPPISSVGSNATATCNVTYIGSTTATLTWKINDVVIGQYRIKNNEVPQYANLASGYDTSSSTTTSIVNTGDTLPISLEIRNVNLTLNQATVSLSCSVDGCITQVQLHIKAGYLSAIELPQPGNQANVATGTTNLMITATVTTSPTECSWSGTGLTAAQFYSSAFGRCQTVTPTATHSITCTNVPGGFSTSLTYLTAMTSNTSISLDCDSAIVYLLSMMVKECSSPTPNNVPVNPSSGVYNTQANFQCSHGSTLFYVNGTTGNTATKCLATAEWENEKIVQCWSAPTATLIGNNTICAGNIATFQCTATGGVPSWDRVEIYFNNQNKTLVGNTWTSNPLSSSNNGDIVECRAINSYIAMQEYSNLGRDSKTLIVHYAAEGFAVNDGTTSHSNICTWYIAPPGPRSCTITFSLNPTNYTTTLTKDGAMVANDATNQLQTSTSQSFVFTQNQPSFNDSGNFTLKINNGIFENTFTFNISVINEVQPTTTTPTTGGTPPPIPTPDNLGVIIGAAVGGVVAFILIIILVVYCLRKRMNKPHQDKEVTGRSNIGMEAEHGYYEVANLSPYQNEHVTNNIPATQSTNYENLKENVNVTRDEQGYADIQGVGPRIVTTPNDGYEVFIKRNENTAGNQRNESQYEQFD